MSLEEIARSWDAFGREDPLWAILTLPGKRNRRWDPEEFFQTGVEEVGRVLSLLESLGLPASRRRALDFGCGVGRLTQALARAFCEVDGVDVARSMVELAERFNRHGGRCRFHLNAEPDLGLFPDGAFDLVYSSYVLQHVPPGLARGYVKEFLRVLSPGGVALFQLPAEPRPGASAPLPDGAFRARLSVSPPPGRLRTGEPWTLAVQVVNEGSGPWPCRGDGTGRFQVNVGNHWLSEDGGLVAQDDGRAPLPADLAPGASAEVELTVTPPGRPGPYLLEVDLVQEGVAWFAERGSPPCRLAVPVGGEASPAPAEGAPAPAPPRMEMHGVPPADVALWVEEAGGRIAERTGLVSTGREFLEKDWVSWLYAAVRR
ncbi:methyltransferase domain-containing protein [Acidobacteria bacterium ACD]|nr:MAG: methyltransferase domain-containing protein [Acidobacteriota bacterium]MDL1949684.1 methyltransferase domain-containing protein [Acidobacteria bacterium ACD]